VVTDRKEELERRSGLCILIHRQNRFCHRKWRPVLGGWKNFKEPSGCRQFEVDIWFFFKTRLRTTDISTLIPTVTD
jgi:hypothetical protein